jgi:hypothetical protein
MRSAGCHGDHTAGDRRTPAAKIVSASGFTSVIFVSEFDAWFGKLVQPIGQTIKDSIGGDIAFKKPNFE